MITKIETSRVCIHPSGRDEYHYRVIMPSKGMGRDVEESIGFDIYTQDISDLVVALKMLQAAAGAEDKERERNR